MKSQVCPRAKEGGQVHERVQTQSIIAVVRQVGHEYTDLGWRNRDRVEGVKRGKRGRNREKEIHTYWMVQNCDKVKISFPKFPCL